MKVVEALRLRINSDAPFDPQPITLGGLIERYIEQELPERYPTQRSYLAILKRSIDPNGASICLVTSRQ